MDLEKCQREVLQWASHTVGEKPADLDANDSFGKAVRFAFILNRACVNLRENSCSGQF